MPNSYFGLNLLPDQQLPEHVLSSTTNTPTNVAFTDYNTFAAAVIAITGDTYNSGTHQFTTGGATGLTHAQWATLAALLNTALGDFNTASTATVTGADVELVVKTSSSPAINDVAQTLSAFKNYMLNGMIAKPGLPL